MLAIEVEFLLGRYSATDFRDRERAEWPPHPSRLFSALVAAFYESGLEESTRAALLWLESLPPPQLCADPTPAEQTAVTAFVPVNDPKQDYLPARAERRPRCFPAVVPAAKEPGAASAVHFVWPDAQPDAVLRDLLNAILGNVTYLGSSRSPVRVRLDAQPPPPNWVPDDEGDTLLRVPAKGRLERLDQHYRSGLRPPPGAFQRYRCGERPREAVAHTGTFGEMVVFRLTGPVGMEIETTLKLTDALRAAVIRRAQDAGPVVPEVLSGHDTGGRPLARTHAAYLALPFASDTQAHADGRVMGLAVALPRGMESGERRAAVRPLLQLNRLSVSGVGQLSLERLTVESVVPYNLRPATWTGPARRWASVTPVVLDRFPKNGEPGMRAIIERSCAHAGLLQPEEVSTGRFSPLYGVEPSFRFGLRRPRREPRFRLYTHVTLAFAEAVQGPVMVGAGRYFGLGLLRPLQEVADHES